ncbi:phosphoadenosine phosphosulfate reductase family protein [Hymenobacter koreensis]|uniref:Phosphoadenosine phosphosulfate reductase family protein n=2 Tax=Hymenobacter koreensis TaxID=1084523 RepID=A0ABP8JN55_9BACT
MMTLLEMEKGLGPDDFVIFCNTGLEDEGTLKFLHQQQTILGVPLRWIEYCRFHKWKEVTYETASRNAEPFIMMMLAKQAVPSGHMGRFCTTELKIKTKIAFMRSQGHRYFEAVIGIRADEPTRHFTGKESADKWHHVAHPLYHGGITKPDVLDFWKAQPFDLDIHPLDGNCVLCFQKGAGKKVAILQRRPELRTGFYLDTEDAMGHPWSTRYAMQDLVDRAQRANTQTSIEFWEAQDEPSISCFCTD